MASTPKANEKRSRIPKGFARTTSSTHVNGERAVSATALAWRTTAVLQPNVRRASEGSRTSNKKKGAALEIAVPHSADAVNRTKKVFDGVPAVVDSVAPIDGAAVRSGVALLDNFVQPATLLPPPTNDGAAIAVTPVRLARPPPPTQIASPAEDDHSSDVNSSPVVKRQRKRKVDADMVEWTDVTKARRLGLSLDDDRVWSAALTRGRGAHANGASSWSSGNSHWRGAAAAAAAAARNRMRGGGGRGGSRGGRGGRGGLSASARQLARNQRIVERRRQVRLQRQIDELEAQRREMLADLYHARTRVSVCVAEALVRVRSYAHCRPV
jgi:hypothetical protein